MSVRVTIVDGPIGPAEPWRVDGAGAHLCFEGTVRPSEDAAPIDGLDYEVYDPMASRMLKDLATQAIERFGVLAVEVTHSRGYVAAGRCSFRLRVASAHRREGIDALDSFIAEMKRDVPIWKTPRPADSRAPS